MKRVASLLVVVGIVALSSGCSIIDRLFLANVDGPYAQQGGCVDGECGPMPHGEPCGQCDGCQHGHACHQPHVGRYGGLAKHHLTAAEKAALAASNYGQNGPAGPPSGAVAYPYYTTRGPRDFLAKCPPSIGPQ